MHGHFGEPCPRCGDTLRRVDFEEHTITYCAACQTGGRILKDRRLSRLPAVSSTGTVPAMSDLPLVGDMQASAPPVALALSRAGVTGVQKAIRIRRGDQEILMAAEIECTVDLARDQKGVHMSRFPELFDEAIDDVVLGEGLLVEKLADRIATQIVERQQRAPGRGADRRPLADAGARTPVTGLPTQEMVSLIGIAAATGAGSRRVVGVEATGINACPCAQGLVRGRAAERLAEAGFGDDVERILELVPIATHNQRGRGTLLVGTASELDAEDLVGIVERSMSAPVYELLKRPDELFVVEHAHLRPRFVEDSVRVALSELLDAEPALGRRRLRPLTPGEPRDDPRPRRRRGALGHGRRAPRRAGRRRRDAAADDARGLAQRALA